MINRLPSSHLGYALVSATLITTLALALYFVVEPRITRAVAVDTTPPFTISQTILGENSFLVDPTSQAMSGSINGLTGGTAYATTSFSVRSNNSGGYFVDIDFADADLDGVAMLGINSGSDAIANYNGGLDADFNFSTAQPNAVFGFTVDSINAGDTADTFLSIASNCGEAAGTDLGGQCWIGPSTTASIRIVDRDAPTASATSTLVFRVYVPSGASPVVAADTYVATATLSLILQ